MRTYYTPQPPAPQTNPGATSYQAPQSKNYTTIATAPKPQAPTVYQPPRPASPTAPTQPYQPPRNYQPPVQMTATFVPTSSVLREERDRRKNSQNQSPQNNTGYTINVNGQTIKFTGNDKNPNKGFQSNADAVAAAQAALGLSTRPTNTVTPPRPPIKPGEVNVSFNPDGSLKTNVPLADIISQGGPAFNQVKDEATVMSGQAGQPKGISTGNPFYDQFLGIPTGFQSVGGNWTPADTPRQAVVTVNGKPVTLPNNFVEMNGIIYKYENGEWKNTNQNGMGGWENALPDGFTVPGGGTIPRSAAPKPPAFDYMGRPLGYGGQVVWDENGNVIPEVAAQYEAQGLEIPGNYTPGIQLANPGLIPGTSVPNINNTPLADVVSTGGSGLSNLISFANTIKSLGLDPNVILRNPQLASSIMKLGLT